MMPLADHARAALRGQLGDWMRPHALGRVRKLAGTVVEIEMTGVALSDVVEIEQSEGDVACEVVGFRESTLLAIPLSPAQRIAPNAIVRARGALTGMPVGDALIGRLIDAFGRPLDGGPVPACSTRIAADRPALPIEERAQVDRRFDTGVRAIDALLTCGRGQRVGIFAGAGCGKSVLVEQIASQADADVIVVGLVGERGREVRELMQARAVIAW